MNGQHPCALWEPLQPCSGWHTGQQSLWGQEGRLQKALVTEELKQAPHFTILVGAFHGGQPHIGPWTEGEPQTSHLALSQSEQ